MRRGEGGEGEDGERPGQDGPQLVRGFVGGDGIVRGAG